MFESLATFLSYFSTVNVVAYFFFPASRKWITIISSLLFIVLTAVHIIAPSSVSYTRFLLFNFIAVIPVCFLRMFGPMPVIALRNIRGHSSLAKDHHSGLGQVPCRPDDKSSTSTEPDFTRFLSGDTPLKTFMKALGITILVGFGVIMFFVIGATSVGWKSTLISLYFLLPLLHPGPLDGIDASDAVISVLLYFFSGILAVVALAFNEFFLHFSTASQEANFLLIWPGYGSPGEMFFAVCLFSIFFQLYTMALGFR